jgi:hypothetical protein
VTNTVNKMNQVRFFRFAWMLPLAQLLIALALWAYEPFQLVNEETKALNASLTKNNLPPLTEPPRLGSQSALFRPPLAGRILYVINLPARVLSDFLSTHIHRSPLWGMTWPRGDDPWNPKPGTTVYIFGLRELFFFLGVVLLWLYAAHKIDRFIAKRQSTLATKRRLWMGIELGAVLSIAVWLLVDCLKIIAHEDCCPHERQVALFGLFWPVALFIYGAVILGNGFRLHRWQKRERERNSDQNS